MKVAILGGGKMGEAFLAGLLESGVVDRGSVRVAESDPGRREYIESKFSVGAVGTSADAVIDAGVVLVAVKPDDVPGCLETVGGQMDRDALVISIAAGVRIASLRSYLPEHGPIVRAMPNLGATVGAGVTAYAADLSLDDGIADIAELVLGATGPVVRVDESDLDLVTAISGSGPAYVFALAEAMERSAIEAGLSSEVASLLVVQTVLGAGRLLSECGADQPGGLNSAGWREAVTSKGGTTAAALAEFERGDFSGLVKRAVEAARARSVELGS